MTDIKTLAAARCINDADWGSERQIAAENAFYSHVESILSPANYHKLECRNWKASTDEAWTTHWRSLRKLRRAPKERGNEPAQQIQRPVACSSE